MAFETSSYASSSLQSNDAPMELLQLLENLNKQQQQQEQKHEKDERQKLLKHLPQQENEEKQQKQHSIQQKQHVELSQIELIYRAEGNANLVLALPQFKKVLRLPKILKEQQQQHQLESTSDRTLFNQKYPKQKQQQQQQLQREEEKQQEPTDMTSTNTSTSQYGQQKQQQQLQLDNKNAVGILTMDHYVAYIAIIRCLLGDEFVYEADIVAVPNPNDRDWINEHIKPYRPVNRLDKEFGGHYGLLLPDATGLPSEFDILFSNLQGDADASSFISCPQTQTEIISKKSTATTKTTGEATPCYPCHVDEGSGVTGGNGHNIFAEDTYAIEIKPKQGWLLPNNVNDLFVIKPTTTTTPEPPRTFEVPQPPAAESKQPLKKSTDKEYLTDAAIQKLTSAPTVETSTSSSIFSTEATTSLLTSSTPTASAATVAAKNAHLLHEMSDIRCRYCSMQHLKLKQQNINEISKYCPMSLFSGIPSLMEMALDALFKCPQNNLRIYKNGILIFDEKICESTQIDELFTRKCIGNWKMYVRRVHMKPPNELNQTNGTQLHLSSAFGYKKIASLLSAERLFKKQYQMEDGEEDIMTKDNSKVSEALRDEMKEQKDITEDVHVVSDSKPNASVTFTKGQKVEISSASETAGPVITTTETEVTKVNKTFDATTPSYSLHSATCDMSKPIADVSIGQMNTPEVPSLPKNCVLQKILHLQLLAKTNFQFMLDHKYQVKKRKSFDSLRKLLKKFTENANKLKMSELEPDEQYLLAATALDCSIMITFRSMSKSLSKGQSSFIENPHVICVNGQKFVSKVTLLDLDPKPDSHFAKYCQQTQQILKILQGEL